MVSEEYYIQMYRVLDWLVHCFFIMFLYSSLGQLDLRTAGTKLIVLTVILRSSTVRGCIHNQTLSGTEQKLHKCLAHNSPIVLVPGLAYFSVGTVSVIVHL